MLACLVVQHSQFLNLRSPIGGSIKCTNPADPHERIQDVYFGAESEKPQRIKDHTHAARLAIVETVRTIFDHNHSGKLKPNLWLKLLIAFGVEIVTLGAGMLAFKVMDYGVEANKEMRLHIEEVVNTAGEKGRLELENVRHAMEHSTKRHIDDAGERTRLKLENAMCAM
ncbi:hypothetical protein DFP73DRAFT_595723 [Morchella snyderi]|nr:hypothetical protein DFP73DRAFT_595723 [Morchella snyderi]